MVQANNNNIIKVYRGKSWAPCWVKCGLWRASWSSSWSSHESLYVSKSVSAFLRAERQSSFLHSSKCGNPIWSPYLSQYCNKKQNIRERELRMQATICAATPHINGLTASPAHSSIYINLTHLTTFTSKVVGKCGTNFLFLPRTLRYHGYYALECQQHPLSDRVP